jgi:anti-anti-sigma regulatory factor
MALAGPAHMAARSNITVARFSSGVTIRVDGPGTIGESQLMHAFALEVLRGDAARRVIIDLADCAYMDSTFLGGLISLFRRHSAGRFAVYAPGVRRRALFGQSRLDTVLPFVDELPAAGDHIRLDAPQIPSAGDDLARHVIDCHRRLAELGGPDAPELARVADAIAAELDADRRR